MWLGPNAVLAFKREGYSWLDLSPGDLSDVLRYPGFYRVVVSSSEILVKWGVGTVKINAFYNLDSQSPQYALQTLRP